jgi:hypothetical protein
MVSRIDREEFRQCETATPASNDLKTSVLTGIGLMSQLISEDRKLQGEMERLSRNSAMPNERRQNERFKLNAPVILSNGFHEIQAYTRDMSSRGLYLYADSSEDFQCGQNLDFLVKLPPEVTLSDFCTIQCRGRLVRLESTSSNLAGMAVDIIQYSILREARPEFG